MIFFASSAAFSGGWPNKVSSFVRLFVHPARVIYTDFPCLRRKLRVDLGLRGLLRDGVQCVIVTFDQFIERAPSGIFRRDLCALDPRAVGVIKEIVTGFHGPI